jgi:protocatechuate 3,4-dioxygenase beta subunit
VAFLPVIKLKAESRKLELVCLICCVTILTTSKWQTKYYNMRHRALCFMLLALKNQNMKSITLLLTISLPLLAGAQDKKVGGGCEGCDAIFEYGNKKLSAVDTLPDFNEKGPKMLVTGTIFKPDGKTPAKDVILYIYHTDQTGEYSKKGNETGWGKRHGYIRGWIKTGADGKYSFYTLRPAAYPGRKNPEHIHPTIKEPGYSPYWIDEYLFEDDPILTTEEKNRQQGRGGKGIIKVTKNSKGIQVAKRDITLGLNVSLYE